MNSNNVKHFKVLVADDEASVTTAVALVLRREGHAVDVAGDGEEAFAKITRDPDGYQVLITDHVMQKMSGFDLVARLRETAFRGSILVLSGRLSSKLMDEFRALGAEHFIHKPFELSELRRMVQQLGEAALFQSAK